MRLSVAWPSVAAMIFIGFILYKGGGAGFAGTANFNYSVDKRGGIFRWIRDNTPKDAVFAGHPTFIDGLPLFAKRQVLATTETWHPFYKGYNKEIVRRLTISLRAHYSRDLEELVKVLEPTNVDYFIFERNRFYPEELEKAKYFPPLDTFVKQLASRDYTQYAYRKLPAEMDPDNFPCMVFKDRLSVMVDVNCLRAKLVKDKL